MAAGTKLAASFLARATSTDDEVWWSSGGKKPLAPVKRRLFGLAPFGSVIPVARAIDTDRRETLLVRVRVRVRATGSWSTGLSLPTPLSSLPESVAHSPACQIFSGRRNLVGLLSLLPTAKPKTASDKSEHQTPGRAAPSSETLITPPRLRLHRRAKQSARSPAQHNPSLTQVSECARPHRRPREANWKRHGQS